MILDDLGTREREREGRERGRERERSEETSSHKISYIDYVVLFVDSSEQRSLSIFAVDSTPFLHDTNGSLKQLQTHVK